MAQSCYVKMSESIQYYGGTILVVLGVWLAGWFQFDYTWVLGATIMYLVWNKRKQTRKEKREFIREIMANEKLLLSNMKELPSWVRML